MKKSYTKPELYYENFALIEAIAGCDLMSNFNEATGCVAYWDDVFEEWIFADATQGCTSLSDKEDSGCHYVPVPGYSIYVS